MKLAHVLLALVGVTLIAMYVVSTQVTRERFEDGAKAESSAAAGEKEGAPETLKPVTATFPVASSGAARVGVVDTKEAERIDAMVFKAYIDVFGLPPTPATSKHYAALVAAEAMDDAGLKTRVEEDAENALQTIDPKATQRPATAAGKSVGISGPEADASMRALREKSAAAAVMSEPVARVTEDGMGQLGSKLRSIATQVSSLARQYDIPGLGVVKEGPKGVESFINLCK